MLAALKDDGVPCAAASNSPKGNVDMVLDELGIRGYFAVVVDRDMVSVGKPDPELFLTAAKRMGLWPEKCIVVEDSVSGFRAAENARMVYIVVTHGADAEEVKEAKSARGIYTDFEEIAPEMLAGLIGADS